MEKQKNYKETRQLQDANLKKTWYKQAFLVNYMYPLVYPLKQKINPSKFVKLIETKNNSQSIINRLTMSPDIMTFFEGRPIEYAQLVPQIEIYKIYIKDKKHVSESILPFASYTNFQEDWNANAMFSAPFRGREAGIQSVSMQQDGIGKNPFGAMMMRVTLKLVFNDVKTLFKTWWTKDGNPVQYADLIRHSGGVKGSNSNAESKPAAFQIKLSIGWSLNEDNPIFKDTNKGKLFAQAAKNSRMNFIGTLSKHSMEFTDNGAVEITAQYEGALESAMSTTNSDILNNYNLDNKNIRTIKANLAQLENNWEWDAEKKAFGVVKAEYTDLKKQQMALEKLKETAQKAADLVKAAKGEQTTFVDLNEAVDKDYEAFKETLKGYKNTAEFIEMQLTNAVKNIPIDEFLVSGAHESMAKAATDTGVLIHQKLEESRQHEEALRKERTSLLQSIQALEASARAQILFGHIEQLMKRDRVGWINMEGNKAFESYTKYRDLLKDAAKVKKEEDKELADIAEADAIEAADQAQLAASGMSPANTDSKQIQSAADNMQNKLNPKSTTETICYGEMPITVPSFKKIGGAANLFSSETGAKGEKLMFFLLGDLISMILTRGQLGESLEQQTPDFRVIFGNIDYSPPMSTQYSMASLYYLPISLEVFTNFLAQKIVGKGRKSYPLITFIRDLVKFIVDKVVAPSGAAAQGQAMVNPTSSKKFKLGMTSIGLPKKFLESKMSSKGGIHLNPILDLGFENNKKYNAMKRMPINKISNAFLLTPRTEDPFRVRARELQVADPVLDKEEGIPHFMVGGPNRGLLKTIKFIDSTDPLWSMSLMRESQDGEVLSGRGIIQPKMFQCEMTLIGNPYFYVGQQFYVNTALISAGLFEKENILNGGYYLVISVQTEISVGKWETRVKGTLVLADSAIRKGKKSAKKTVQKIKDESPAKQAELQQKQKEAKQQTKSAVKNTPTPQPPNADPCAPKGGQRC